MSLALLIAVQCGPASVRGQGWESASPEFRWQFPRDHWAHSGYKTEWWYITGQLVDVADSSKRFGYQFTFFRVGVSPDSLPVDSDWAVTDLIMGHLALTDVTAGEHRFSELVYRANGLLGGFARAGDTLVAWSRAPVGTDGIWDLRWNGSGFEFSARDTRLGIAIDLETRPRKPLVFQGPNGHSRKGRAETAASLYYSFTRLATRGTVTIDGREHQVSGESWMDKEFGSNQLTEDQVGWDWFSLRLSDGRDVMLYLLRDRDGSVDFARATIVDSLGTPRYVPGDEWQVDVIDTWHSPITATGYPVSWRLTSISQGTVLVVTAEIPNQENVSSLIPGLFYWEGSVRVTDPSGQPLGIGYVELTGYGTASPLVI